VTERDRLIAHEAGHAAAAVLLKATPTAIEVRDDGGGVTVPLDIDKDSARDLLLIALAGRIGHDEPGWPPAWPPSRTKSHDEHHAAILAEHLDLDAAGWQNVCAQAWRLASTRPFTRLERTFATALKRSTRLDAKAIDALIGDTMQHFTLKAAITPTTDQGTFTAVISTEALDRENDRVSAAGMVRALSKWPRPIPLTWEHGTEPKDIIGMVYPDTVKNVGGEAVAQGKVDLESRHGADAWRAFQAKSLGFSFHYLTLAATKNAEGGQDIAEFDVFEITATRMPMNNRTRVLGTKAADNGGEPLSRTEVERQLVQRGLITRTLGMADTPATDSDVAEAERLLMTDLLTTVTNGDKGERRHYDKAVASPWIADPDDYTDSEWAAACVLDLAEGIDTLADAPAKQRWRLPVRRPGATKPDRAGLEIATHDLVQSTAPTDAKRAAATRLLTAYAEAGIEVQDRYLLGLGGKSMAATVTRTKATAPIHVAEFRC
jgi:hypothetical protein